MLHTKRRKSHGGAHLKALSLVAVVAVMILTSSAVRADGLDARVNVNGGGPGSPPCGSMQFFADANGAFNVPEFGTVKDEKQYQALRAYSPYYNVKDGEKYPAVLFLTGANDPRVDPMQSRKMTARLQSATAGKAPRIGQVSSLMSLK